jgi:hypothetical protein
MRQWKDGADRRAERTPDFCQPQITDRAASWTTAFLADLQGGAVPRRDSASVATPG